MWSTRLELGTTSECIAYIQSRANDADISIVVHSFRSLLASGAASSGVVPARLAHPVSVSARRHRSRRCFCAYLDPIHFAAAPPAHAWTALRSCGDSRGIED